jgi:hypothetical protein
VLSHRVCQERGVAGDDCSKTTPPQAHPILGIDCRSGIAFEERAGAIGRFRVLPSDRGQRRADDATSSIASMKAFVRGTRLIGRFIFILNAE